MTTKAIGVRKLKDNLSSYLKEVESGTVILVSDRDRIVAEIHEPAAGEKIYDSRNPHLASMVRDGKVLPPTGPKRECPMSPVKLEGLNSLKLLNEDRGE